MMLLNLHCDAGTVSDQDGDALSFEYLWFIDSQSNAPIANGSTLELELDSADVEELICFVAADDGLTKTTATTSKNITELVSTVSSTIQTSYTNEALIYSCDASVSTPEGLSDVSIEYAWYREGDPIPLFRERDFPLTYFVMEYYE